MTRHTRAATVVKVVEDLPLMELEGMCLHAL